MKCWAHRGAVFLLLLLAPTLAYAQASLVGVVRDTSGAVLPGVTVEAASPVLIEQVQSAVTNRNGRYQLIDLRPGTYSVTFTVPGFATVRREAFQLAGSDTVTLGVECASVALRRQSGYRPTSSLIARFFNIGGAFDF